MVVTPETGFPGPGPLRRYRTSELQALANNINATTPPSCRSLKGASVNWWMSRVDVNRSLDIEVAGAVQWPPALTLRERAMVDLNDGNGAILGCVT